MTARGETFGKYELIRRIAFGGMAEIFLARLQGEQGFAKQVVLKRILPQFGADENFVRMFVDEAVIAAKLTHANVVQVYDFGDVGGVYFIAMEWVDGIDLSTLNKRLRQSERRLRAVEVAAIGEGVCRGLGYAHNVSDDERGPLRIVHRDISPHNIMLSRSGEAKVMDFGIAKAEERATRTKTGMIKGKIAYMAPEQARGLSLDKRADQFAVGLVLWECLTGRRMFEGDTDFELLRLVAECHTRAARELDPGIPEALDAIVMRALAPEPEGRYPDLADMEQALSAFRFSLGADGAVRLGTLVDEVAPRRPSGPVRRTMDLEDHTPGPAAVTSAAGTRPQRPPAMLDAESSDPGEDGDAMDLATAAEFAMPPGEAAEPTHVGGAADGWEPADGSTSATLDSTPRARDAAPDAPWALTASTTAAARSESPARAWRRWGGAAALVVALAVGGLWLVPWLRSDAAPALGTVIVESDPAGAEIVVQGAAVGLSTPAPIPEQPLGQPLQIEVRLAGHTSARRVVTLTQAVEQVHFTLTQSPVAPTPAPSGPAPVASAVEAAEAEAVPDAKAQEGEGPPVRPGKPRGKGKRKDEGSERVAATPPPVASEAPAGKGKLSLRVRDGWADVYLKKQLIGTTPLSETELPAGTHVLRLVNPELGVKKEITVSIEPGGHARRTVALSER